ncbi:MAG: DUF3553 domain-containing protein [Geobacteraceae bacterium]|nr:DUF3553 domain-containing protein [Geobacteraceae bacterium]
MYVKRGKVVRHTVKNEWGAGMVVEVNDGRATIQFSDGILRKIAVSHFCVLQPADPASYLPPPDKVLEAKKVRAVRSSKKKQKEPEV